MTRSRPGNPPRCPDWPRGFSLVELLVVIAIVSVLATIGLPLAELAHKRTREEDLRRSLREIRHAIDEYKQMSDLGRIQHTADSSGYPPTLDALVQGVPDAQSPRGEKLYFLRQLPRDPFAPTAETASSAAATNSAADTWALRSYQSPPNNPQPGRDVFDVHSKSTELGLNGVPYQKW